MELVYYIDSTTPSHSRVEQYFRDRCMHNVHKRYSFFITFCIWNVGKQSPFKHCFVSSDTFFSVLHTLQKSINNVGRLLSKPFRRFELCSLFRKIDSWYKKCPYCFFVITSISIDFCNNWKIDLQNSIS